jgi:hypothetical protein
MKADPRISIKDHQRSKNLKILLLRARLRQGSSWCG